MSLATKIPAHHIEALEKGDLASMPGRAYSRAFLRTYASYLGLDADGLLELLPAPSVPPQSGFPPPLWRPGIGWVFVTLATVLVLGVFVVGCFALQAVVRRDTPTPAASVLDVATPRPTQAAIDAPPPPTPTPPVNLTIRATERTTVTVAVDGASVFSGSLQLGESKDYSAVNLIHLWTANAGGVDVTYNGNRRGPLGKKNEVVEIEWTFADNAKTTPGPLSTPVPTATPPAPTPTGERPR